MESNYSLIWGGTGSGRWVWTDQPYEVVRKRQEIIEMTADGLFHIVGTPQKFETFKEAVEAVKVAHVTKLLLRSASNGSNNRL